MAESAQHGAPRFQIDIARLGLPGYTMHLVTVGRSKANPDAACNKSTPGGAPGQYRVTFVLSRPGFALNAEYKHSFADLQGGDSHLAITKPAYVNPEGDFDQIQVVGRSPDGVFRFNGLANDRGFLGKIVSDPFEAKSMQDAEQMAHRALAPSLSHWAAELDIPIFLYQIESCEEATGNRRSSMLPPYPPTPWGMLPDAKLSNEFLGAASIYREALNSNSPPYQYLCLFKIIEAILERRGCLMAEAKQRGEKPPTHPRERVPADQTEFVPWLNAIFPVRPAWDPMDFEQIFISGAKGRKFGYIIESHLRPLRVKIAHALSESTGELTLSADELLHIREVNKWLPLSKCIVRRLLKNQYADQFLGYLNEDGTFKK